MDVYYNKKRHYYIIVRHIIKTTFVLINSIQIKCPSLKNNLVVYSSLDLCNYIQLSQPCKLFICFQYTFLYPYNQHQIHILHHLTYSCNPKFNCIQFTGHQYIPQIQCLTIFSNTSSTTFSLGSEILKNLYLKSHQPAKQLRKKSSQNLMSFPLFQTMQIHPCSWNSPFLFFFFLKVSFLRFLKWKKKALLKGF